VLRKINLKERNKSEIDP